MNIAWEFMMYSLLDEKAKWLNWLKYSIQVNDCVVFQKGSRGKYVVAVWRISVLYLQE